MLSEINAKTQMLSIISTDNLRRQAPRNDGFLKSKFEDFPPSFLVAFVCSIFSTQRQIYLTNCLFN